MVTYCPYCMSQTSPGQLCPDCGKNPADYHPSSHHFPIGRLLRDRYLVGKVLGEGGFGITYLGLDTTLQRRVAVKEYFPNVFVHRETSVSLDVTCYAGEKQTLYEKGRDQFLQEARVMARFDGFTEIVQVLDFFPANNTAYIVMELLTGNTLRTLLTQQKRIPAKYLFDIMEPVLRAMNAMHGAGIIHRDISPDNMMLLDNGQIKLLDFGCARDADKEHTMTVMLKHGYAPVEQYTGYNQGPWTDIYALCATCYHCLTGATPPRALERMTAQDPLKPPNSLGAALTPEQEQALMRGLAVEPRDRWQSIAGLYAALYGTVIKDFPWLPDEEKTEIIPESELEQRTMPIVPNMKQKAKPKAAPESKPEQVPEPESVREKKGGSPLSAQKKKLLGITAACCLVLLIIFGLSGKKDKNVPAPSNPPLVPASSEQNETEQQDKEIVSDKTEHVISKGTLKDGIAIAAGSFHTVCLKSDGTVAAIGKNGEGACNVADWTDIVDISAGSGFTVGLKSDGTVVAAGVESWYAGIDSWSDIAAVSAGNSCAVGLKSDGTVVIAGPAGIIKNGNVDINSWTDITAVSMGSHHLVALKSNGRVVAAGNDDNNECHVKTWKDIVAVAAGNTYTVGLKSDGTVMMAGDFSNPALVAITGGAPAKDIAGWTDIIAIATGDDLIVGLKSDGTVVAVGSLYDYDGIADWTDITAISAGYAHTVGLKSDGTVVAVGMNSYGECDVDG